MSEVLPDHSLVFVRVSKTEQGTWQGVGPRFTILNELLRADNAQTNYGTSRFAGLYVARKQCHPSVGESVGCSIG